MTSLVSVMSSLLRSIDIDQTFVRQIVCLFVFLVTKLCAHSAVQLHPRRLHLLITRQCPSFQPAFRVNGAPNAVPVNRLAWLVRSRLEVKAELQEEFSEILSSIDATRFGLTSRRAMNLASQMSNCVTSLLPWS